MYDVVALGEALVDFTWQGENEEGYPLLSAHPGGAPGNFLAALSAYGAKTAMLAKVGEDAFGTLLRQSLAGAGIETGGVVTDPTVFTTLPSLPWTRGGSGASASPASPARTPACVLRNWICP